LDSLWGRLSEALIDFDVDAVAADRSAVRARLWDFVNHRLKADAVFDTAIELAGRPQLWDRLQRMSSAAFLDEMLEFKGIGRENRFHTWFETWAGTCPHPVVSPKRWPKTCLRAARS
jgi:hypothetical protein